MCYKEEVQLKNEEKLERKLNEERVPRFIRNYITNKESMLGALNYWSVVRNLLLWLMSEKIINKSSIADIVPEDMKFIEAADINRYLKLREKNGISPTTLYVHKNIFSGFWKSMKNSHNVPVESNIIEDVAYTGMESNNNYYTRMPSEEDIAEMENNIKKKHDDFVRERNLIVFEILKGTGLRECEIAELEFSSLFLEGSLERDIPHIKIVGKGKYRQKESRMVLLSDTVKNAFKDWLEIRATLDNIVDEKAIFLNKNGKRLNEDNVRNMFKTYSKGKLTGHMMRHWYATVASKRFGVVFAQQQLGHKNSNITVNTYTDGAFGLKDALAAM